MLDVSDDDEGHDRLNRKPMSDENWRHVRDFVKDHMRSRLRKKDRISVVTYAKFSTVRVVDEMNDPNMIDKMLEDGNQCIKCGFSSTVVGVRDALQLFDEDVELDPEGKTGPSNRRIVVVSHGGFSTGPVRGQLCEENNHRELLKTMQDLGVNLELVAVGKDHRVEQYQCITDMYTPEGEESTPESHISVFRSHKVLDSTETPHLRCKDVDSPTRRPTPSPVPTPPPTLEPTPRPTNEGETRNPSMPPTPAPVTKDSCVTEAVYVIDVDKGTNEKELVDITDMVKDDIVKRLPENSRVSVVTYQKSAKTRVPMTDASDMDKIAEQLSDLLTCREEFDKEYCNASNLARGLKTAVEQFSDDEEVMARRIVIITDSTSEKNHEDPSHERNKGLRDDLEGIGIDVVNLGGDDPHEAFDRLFSQLQKNDPDSSRSITDVESSATLSGTSLPSKVCPTGEETPRPTMSPTAHIIPVCPDCDCDFDWEEGRLDDTSATCNEVPTGKCPVTFVRMRMGEVALDVPCYFDGVLRTCIGMTSCAKSPDDSDSGDTPVTAPTFPPFDGFGSGSADGSGDEPPFKQCVEDECQVVYPAACIEAGRTRLTVDLDTGVGVVAGGVLVETKEAESAAECRELCRSKVQIRAELRESETAEERAARIEGRERGRGGQGNGRTAEEQLAWEARQAEKKESAASSYEFNLETKSCKCFAEGELQSCGVVGDLS